MVLLDTNNNDWYTWRMLLYVRQFSIAHLDEGRIVSWDRTLDTFGLMAKRESGPVKWYLRGVARMLIACIINAITRAQRFLGWY